MTSETTSQSTATAPFLAGKIQSQEDLVNLGKEIRRLAQKKKQADEHLVELEARIYGLETEYFKETGAFGSIMTGLEGYLGLMPTTGGQATASRRSTYREVKDAARIFSNTSASSRRAVGLYNKYNTNKTLAGAELYEEDSDDGEELGEEEDIIIPATSNKRARTGSSSSSATHHNNNSNSNNKNNKSSSSNQRRRR